MRSVLVGRKSPAASRVERFVIRLGTAIAVCVALLVACGPVASTAPSPRASASPAPRSSAAGATAGDAVRISLSGAAPDALVLVGDRAWVLAGEGGTLMEVDLAERRELRSIDVGFGATHLAVLDDGTVAVGRFDDSGSGSYLVLVDPRSEAVRGVATGALGGLALGEGGFLWALERADRLVKVDSATGEIVGHVAVDIGENVHTEVQWGAGSAWVGSDGTPVFRVDGDDLALAATTEIPSGLPFLFEGGLVWGAGSAALWAIDPATNNVVVDVPLEDVIEILGMAVEDKDVWLAVRRPGHVGRVLRLTLPGGHAVGEFEVDLPAAVKLGADRAWVASYLGDELVGFPR